MHLVNGGGSPPSGDGGRLRFLPSRQFLLATVGMLGFTGGNLKQTGGKTVF